MESAPIYASGEHGGYSWRKELDLSKGDFESIIIPPSVNEFSKYYVSVSTSNAAGITGSIDIKQGPTRSAETHDTAPLGSIALVADGRGSDFGEVHGAFISLTLPAGLPTTGKIDITVVAKDN